jgi:hypothetical protein
MNAVCSSRSTAQHSTAVIRAVAAHDGVDETELPPLYDAVDPDALDALLASTRADGPGQASVTFEYAGHTVVVSGDGTVSLEQDCHTLSRR